MRVVGDGTGIVPRGPPSRSDALPLAVEPGQHPTPADRRAGEPPNGPVDCPRRYLDDAECFAHVDSTDVAFRHTCFANQRPDEILGAGAVLLADPDEDSHPRRVDRPGHRRSRYPAS